MRTKHTTTLLKRLGAWALTFALVVGLLPQTAFAAGTDTGKAIQLVENGTAANISGWNSTNGYDYIYYGTWSSNPIKWRVLSMSGNGGTYSDGTSTVDASNAMFLLSDELLGTGKFGGMYFQENLHYDSSSNNHHKGNTPSSGDHTNCQIANAWQGSDAQAWCSTFYNSRLTTQEQGAVLATTKSDGAFTSSTNKNPFAASNNILNGDKVFFLSAEEAETSGYGFGSDNDRKANYNGSAGYWRLRSPHALYTNCAGIVNYSGKVSDDFVSGNWATRPAFNLDMNSVLFTSAAVGGKSSAAVSGGQGGEAADAIFEIGDYSGNEWKLTLLDEAHKNFEISNATVNGSGDTIAFSYSGAQTGTNEYISVIIENNGAITHYGRILQLDGTTNDASGTASLTLPADVSLGGNTKLYVFNEQYNGDKMTDYASQLREISRPTVDNTAPKLSNGSATRTSATAATVKFTSDEAGSYYYVMDSSETLSNSMDTSGEGTSCSANTETTISLDSLSDAYIHIVVKDAVNNVSNVLTIQIPAYTFTVTVNVDTSGEGAASASPTTAAPDTEITLTATPETGYHFKEWQVTSGSLTISETDKATNPLTISMPAENVTVKAVFEAHSFTQENTDSEYLASSATCTQAATYYKSCSCGAKGTDTFTSGEALGHTWSDWTSNGNNEHTRTCSECNDSETVKCSGGTATCVDKAFCDICKSEYGTVDADNHTNLVKTDAKQATHLTEGNTEYWYCNGCDKYFSDEAGTTEITLADTVLPKLTGHTPDGTGWNKDSTSHWNTCECGETMNKAEHTFKWVIDAEATATQTGSKHEECTVCGYKKDTVEIPATATTAEPSQPTEKPDTTTPTDKEEPSGTNEAPATGDTSNYLLCLILAMASGVGLTGITVYGRRKKQDR